MYFRNEVYTLVKDGNIEIRDVQDNGLVASFSLAAAEDLADQIIAKAKQGRSEASVVNKEIIAFSDRDSYTPGYGNKVETEQSSEMPIYHDS